MSGYSAPLVKFSVSYFTIVYYICGWYGKRLDLRPSEVFLGTAEQGEHGYKGLKIRETGEQSNGLRTGNWVNQGFDFE